MKKALLVVLALLISVAFVTTVFAEKYEKETKTTTTTKAKAMEFRGEVTAMDMAAKTITVKGNDGDKTFDVTDAKMKGEAKAGDMVTVKYMEKDGKMIASWVGMDKREKTETTTTTETKEKTTK
jgi:phage baseplate assembly protein gpV